MPLPLPMSAAEMTERGWNEIDVVFISGDAYVDHPSFSAALLARVLEAEGLRVALLAQPDWHSCEAWKTFGRPRLAFCVSAGNMDSMINHYTANRKVRNEDAYSPGGAIGRRPDRATLAYCQRAREAFPGVPVIVGGVEASLRRLSHYDYWSDKVRRSILLDCKADLLVYGMGETPLLNIVRLLRDGTTLRNEDDGRLRPAFRTLRGTAFRLGAKEDLPEETAECVHLPSHEEVVEDHRLFAEMTKLIYDNLEPSGAATLVQQHALEAIQVNPPSLPLSEKELDRIYALPFTRKPHPSYGKAEIPAFTMIRNSITLHRGCFGGCAFCSIAAHQGKTVQSRSRESILQEIALLASDPHFSGIISDLGGPTANMYRQGCTNPAAKQACRRASCLVPEPCVNLNTDHGPLRELLRQVRELEGIRAAYIASGIRTDLALLDPVYIDDVVRHHIGGHLKTAPEHADPAVLALMNKPSIESHEHFCNAFDKAARKCGKELFIVPYLIAGLPGSTLASMVEVALYLKRQGIRPRQVQEFIPGPFELASCMYYTGLDPMTGKPVYVAHRLRERRLQKALLLYHDPGYYHDVKSALKETGREDLIGTGSDCLIPPYPPKKEMALRRSARVKRLQKNQAREKLEKEKRRAELMEQARPVIKPPQTETSREQRGNFERKNERSGSGERGPRRESFGRKNERSGSGERGPRRESFGRKDERSGSGERGPRRESFGRKDSSNGRGNFGNRGKRPTRKGPPKR